ncbi:MAG: hypothetical protein KJ000_32725 [Pirellulaceae bacterium]|nr:hypothetical protein [Pirellulaceae bacterium]
MTLVIEDASGRRVRNLVGMAPRGKGRQTDACDGLDEAGNLAAPGSYRWRGLFHQGIDPVYEASYGTAGIPPWDTADNTGAWLSDHNTPTAVACGKDRIVLAAGGAEAGWALIGTDYNGRKKWGERKFQGIRCVAVDDTHLYAGMNPWDAKESRIGRLELKSAKYAPFETQPGPLLMLPPAKEGEKATVTGIAVVGDRLAVALAGHAGRSRRRAFLRQENRADRSGSSSRCTRTWAGSTCSPWTGCLPPWSSRTAASGRKPGRMKPIAAPRSAA